MSTELSSLDAEAIENLRSINPDDGGEFLSELVDLCLADAPQRIAEIEACAGNENFPTLARAAHSLKGTSAALGASKFTGLARAIELDAQQGNLDAIRAGLLELRAEFARLRPALEQLKRDT